jgi:hypothetical protein
MSEVETEDYETTWSITIKRVSNGYLITKLEEGREDFEVLEDKQMKLIEAEVTAAIDLAYIIQDFFGLSGNKHDVKAFHGIKHNDKLHDSITSRNEGFPGYTWDGDKK